MPVQTSDGAELRSTLGVHRDGRFDPTTVLSAGELWRAARTPDGPGTLHIVAAGGAGDVRAEAWGPGARWLLDGAPALLGAHDDPSALVPRHAVVAEAQRRHRDLRIGRSGQVLRALVPAVLAQRVTSIEAARSWSAICRALGEPAPGPRRLTLPPRAEDLATRPYWWYHRFGVDRRRAETIRHAAAHVDRLEEAASMPLEQAHQRLGAFPGVGAWTVATVAGTALGDQDAVVLGDYHLPHIVSFALTGARRGTDERMLELLEPYRGQRGRVLRLLSLSGIGPPRRVPRQAIMPVASW